MILSSEPFGRTQKMIKALMNEIRQADKDGTHKTILIVAHSDLFAEVLALRLLLFFDDVLPVVKHPIFMRTKCTNIHVKPWAALEEHGKRIHFELNMYESVYIDHHCYDLGYSAPGAVTIKD